MFSIETHEKVTEKSKAIKIQLWIWSFRQYYLCVCRSYDNQKFFDQITFEKKFLQWDGNKQWNDTQTVKEQGRERESPRHMNDSMQDMQPAAKVI